MSPDSIVVTSLGMVSSLGLSVTSSCAAARAGMSGARALGELPVATPDGREMVSVRGHAVHPLSRGFTGLGLLVRLAAAAVTDLMSYSSLPNDGKTGIVVNISSGYYLTARENDAHAKLDGLASERTGNQELHQVQLRHEHYVQHLIPRLSRISGLAVDPRASAVLCKDQTPMSDAFRLATTWLKERGVDRCVIGGVDSCIEPTLVGAFDHFCVLKTEARPTGFLPGEAAAFLLLERLEVARRRDARVEAVLHEPQRETELGDRLSGPPPTGAALARVITRALAQLPERGRRVGLIVDGLNGDDYRAADWGSALVRLRKTHPEAGRKIWHPAESFGETGAATGPLAACVAVRALARGYAATNEILAWTASDTSEREAFCVGRFDA